MALHNTDQHSNHIKEMKQWWEDKYHNNTHRPHSCSIWGHKQETQSQINNQPGHGDPRPPTGEETQHGYKEHNISELPQKTSRHRPTLGEG
ncbi:hypothetical protein GDO81_024542 [Engystomops pustulosus]|uniref:Uncharacterized protein n=1 Tax=Engystomops pustulosus TaxID=76066 RepID=A0AAV6YTV8_ENGPU|nr:hypothetical protein GDO81_024542 [Engystomops pustulosus]